MARKFANVMAWAFGLFPIAWAFRSNQMWFDGHVLSNYCPCAASTLALETGARWAAAAFGAIVAILIRPRLVRWLERAGSWRGTARIVGAATFALVASDLYLRWKEARRHIETEPGLPPMRVDETGNYAPIPSSTREWDVHGRLVRYETNADGDRAPRTTAITDTRAPTILFTGESIAMGWGVDYDRSYPVLVGRALGVQIANVAVTGFALDQAYLRLRERMARFENPIAVVTLVLPVELERTVSDRRQRLALDDAGKLELVPRSSSPFATSPLQKLVPYHSDEAISLAREIIRATAEAARARGARALFVFTNFGPPCLPERDGISRLERTLFFGLEVAHAHVEIEPSSMIAPPREVHPNEKGHEIIASAVVAALGGQNIAKP